MKEKNVKINENQLDILIENIFLKGLKEKFIKLKESSSKLKNSHKTNTFSISVSQKDKEKITIQLGNVLAEKGLDPDSEPNEFGLMIEELIDIFSPYKD